MASCMLPDEPRLVDASSDAAPEAIRDGRALVDDAVTTASESAPPTDASQPTDADASNAFDAKDATAERDTGPPADAGDASDALPDRDAIVFDTAPDHSIGFDTAVDADADARQDGPLDVNRDASPGCLPDAGVQPVLSAGVWHTCGLSTRGVVSCWGYNENGQLGDGTSMNTQPTPTLAQIGAVRSVVAGSFDTCAITLSGGLRCWGDNGAGQMAISADIASIQPLPSAIDILSDVRAVSIGQVHICALTNAGGVRCWGGNTDGQLGRGTITSAEPNVPATEVLTGVQAIAAGGYHTCALTIAGGVRCWGNNGSGQLGDGSANTRSTPTSDVLTDVQAISAGLYHTCALSRDGAVRCWGWNDYGQLGDGTLTSRSTPGTSVTLNTSAQAVSAGAAFTCVLTTSGAMRCWGDNIGGQIGDSRAVDPRLTPGPEIPLGSAVRSMTTGDSHSCAVTAAGNTLCWGSNVQGQLGDGRTALNRLAPAGVLGLDSLCR